jgi:magnesium chelatase family protein
MISSVIGSTTVGVNAFRVTIETHVEKTLPKVIIVGLPDSAVKESAERVSAAIKNSSLYFPVQKVTVNLAPADVRKEGSGFDLPIAIGILCETEQVKPDMLGDYLFAENYLWTEN